MDGLTRQEVEYRKSNGLVNNENIKYSRDIKTIVLSNLLTLFNFINIGLFILVLTTGSLKNSLFIFVVIINTSIAIFQEIKAKKLIDSLTITTQEKIKVKRDGKITEIPTKDLVLDDLMYLKSGDDVVVDSQVVYSKMCEVDESIITGESESLTKKKNDKLISGTIIISGECYAKVTNIGSNNYTNNLIKEASSVEDSKSYLMESVNKILKIVTIAIIPTGILLFLSQFGSSQSYKDAILSTVAGIIGMIPEGLVLLTSIALSAGVIKMTRKKVIVQKLSGIEMLSCTDIICLDKTGTITDGSMEVIDVISLDSDDVHEIISNMVDDNLTNATDVALNKYFPKKNTYKITKSIPFSSYRKYSAKTFNGNKTYALGALEYITDEKISKYDKYLIKYIQEGYRIITLAKSNLEYTDKLPSNMKVIGFVVLKDNIRNNAKETLDYFKSQEVDVKIISGDNPISVSNIMRQLNFDNYDKYIEGANLPTDYNELKRVVNNYTIFGRCTPKQKQLIIRALKEKSKVAMIGDGVNDILALKEADCGIALSTGISAARSVAEVVLTNNDFSVLPDIVLEGRRVVNNIEKVSSMYLVKTTYSFVLSILSIILTHEYPFQPIQLSLIGTICVGLPSFFLALFPNYTKVSFGFIKKVFRNALPSGICVFINILFIIIISELLKLDFEKTRIVIVSLTGLINLRLLYLVSKPFNLAKQLLMVFCSIVFFELLILLPSLFSVTKFNIINIIIIVIFFYADLYIIDFLEEIYDKMLKKFKKGFEVNEKI